MVLTNSRGDRVGETADHGDRALIGPRSCQSPRQPAASLGKISGEIAMIGHHAFLGSRSCQSQRRSTTGLGKTPAKTAIHGHFAFLGHDVAKSRDTPSRTGENSWGNRHSWPFRFIWTEIVPRSAATRGRLGKTFSKSPIMATPKKGGDRIGETMRVGPCRRSRQNGHSSLTNPQGRRNPALLIMTIQNGAKQRGRPHDPRRFRREPLRVRRSAKLRRRHLLSGSPPNFGARPGH